MMNLKYRVLISNDDWATVLTSSDIISANIDMGLSKNNAADINLEDPDKTLYNNSSLEAASDIRFYVSIDGGSTYTLMYDGEIDRKTYAKTSETIGTTKLGCTSDTILLKRFMGPNQCIQKARDIGAVMTGSVYTAYGTASAWSYPSGSTTHRKIYPNSILFGTGYNYSGVTDAWAGVDDVDYEAVPFLSTKEALDYFCNLFGLNWYVGENKTINTVSKSYYGPFADSGFTASNGFNVAQYELEERGEYLADALTVIGTYPFFYQTGSISQLNTSSATYEKLIAEAGDTYENVKSLAERYWYTTTESEVTGKIVMPGFTDNLVGKKISLDGFDGFMDAVGNVTGQKHDFASDRWSVTLNLGDIIDNDAQKMAELERSIEELRNAENENGVADTFLKLDKSVDWTKYSGYALSTQPTCAVGLSSVSYTSAPMPDIIFPVAPGADSVFLEFDTGNSNFLWKHITFYSNQLGHPFYKYLSGAYADEELFLPVTLTRSCWNLNNYTVTTPAVHLEDASSWNAKSILQEVNIATIDSSIKLKSNTHVMTTRNGLNVAAYRSQKSSALGTVGLYSPYWANLGPFSDNWSFTTLAADSFVPADLITPPADINNMLAWDYYSKSDGITTLAPLTYFHVVPTSSAGFDNGQYACGFIVDGYLPGDSADSTAIVDIIVNATYRCFCYAYDVDDLEAWANSPHTSNYRITHGLALGVKNFNNTIYYDSDALKNYYVFGEAAGYAYAFPFKASDGTSQNIWGDGDHTRWTHSQWSLSQMGGITGLRGCLDNENRFTFVLAPSITNKDTAGRYSFSPIRMSSGTYFDLAFIEVIFVFNSGARRVVELAEFNDDFTQIIPKQKAKMFTGIYTASYNGVGLGTNFGNGYKTNDMNAANVDLYKLNGSPAGWGNTFFYSAPSARSVADKLGYWPIENGKLNGSYDGNYAFGSLGETNQRASWKNFAHIVSARSPGYNKESPVIKPIYVEYIPESAVEIKDEYAGDVFLYHQKHDLGNYDYIIWDQASTSNKRKLPYTPYLNGYIINTLNYSHIGKGITNVLGVPDRYIELNPPIEKTEDKRIVVQIDL